MNHRVKESSQVIVMELSLVVQLADDFHFDYIRFLPLLTVDVKQPHSGARTNNS